MLGESAVTDQPVCDDGWDPAAQQEVASGAGAGEALQVPSAMCWHSSKPGAKAAR